MVFVLFSFFSPVEFRLLSLTETYRCFHQCSTFLYISAGQDPGKCVCYRRYSRHHHVLFTLLIFLGHRRPTCWQQALLWQAWWLRLWPADGERDSHRATSGWRQQHQLSTQPGSGGHLHQPQLLSASPQVGQCHNSFSKQVCKPLGVYHNLAIPQISQCAAFFLVSAQVGWCLKTLVVVIKSMFTGDREHCCSSLTCSYSFG